MWSGKLRCLFTRGDEDAVGVSTSEPCKRPRFEQRSKSVASALVVTDASEMIKTSAFSLKSNTQINAPQYPKITGFCLVIATLDFRVSASSA